MKDAARNPVKTTTAEAAPLAMVFVRDQDSEGIVRQCLANLGVAAASYNNGGVIAAITELATKPSPRLLVVDISGTDDPVARVNELAQVCEPSTGVVVVGDVNDVTLYRSLKNTGVVEYYFKPLVSTLVSRTFNTILAGGVEQRGPRTGKLVFVMSVRGGSGATTIATWSAWHLAEVSRRRVLLMDLNLHSGDAALQLDATPTHALREALEHPERVDDLFLERAIVHVTQRLGLLASLESLDEVIPCHEEATLSLLTNLLHRYRYVFVDMPVSAAPELMRVLHLPSLCILVSDDSLVSARDVARWRDKIGSNTVERSTIHVLNKTGSHGGLPMEEFVRAAGRAPEIVIPYEREISTASTLGIKGHTANDALSRALGPVLRLVAGETVEERRPLLSRLFG